MKRKGHTHDEMSALLPSRNRFLGWKTRITAERCEANSLSAAGNIVYIYPLLRSSLYREQEKQNPVLFLRYTLPKVQHNERLRVRQGNYAKK